MSNYLRFSRPEALLAVAFAGALPLAVAAAFGMEALAFKATDGWDWRGLPDSYVALLNTLPSFVAGALVYGIISLAAYKWVLGATSARWAARTIVPLGLSVGLLVLIAMDFRSPDFWLVAQFLFWPLMTVLGGLMAEGSIATYYQRRASHAAANSTVC